MIHGLDTGFMVAAEMREHPQHAAARATIARVVATGDQVAIAPQVLTEFIHIVTDSRRFAQPLDMKAAQSRAEQSWTARDVVRVFPDDQATRLFLAWVAQFSLGRKRLLDTLLAATYRQAGVNSLLTTDPADFGVFGGSPARHPQVRSRSCCPLPFSRPPGRLRGQRFCELEVVEVAVGRLAVPLDFPGVGVGFEVRLFGERRDEGRAVPLETVVREGRVVAVVQGDDVGALVAAVAGVFRVLAAVPVERELVRARLPRLIGQAGPHPHLAQPLEHDRTDFVAEAVPGFEQKQIHRRSIRPVAESVDRQPPEDGPVFGEHVKADRATHDRSDPEHTHFHELALVGLSVVEKFFAEQAVKARNVGIERRQLDVITSGKSLKGARNGECKSMRA